MAGFKAPLLSILLLSILMGGTLAAKPADTPGKGNGKKPGQPGAPEKKPNGPKPKPNGPSKPPSKPSTKPPGGKQPVMTLPALVDPLGPATAPVPAALTPAVTLPATLIPAVAPAPKALTYADLVKGTCPDIINGLKAKGKFNTFFAVLNAVQNVPIRKYMLHVERFVYLLCVLQKQQF